jgi:hypothetical protein
MEPDNLRSEELPDSGSDQLIYKQYLSILFIKTLQTFAFCLIGANTG